MKPPGACLHPFWERVGGGHCGGARPPPFFVRHTGMSRLANHPAIPLVHVRDFARHADLATTQGYVHRIESETVTTAIGEALRA